MLQINDETYVSHMWFVGDQKTYDWLATLSKKDGEKDWLLQYRFRYYDPDSGSSPFDSKDRKSLWEMEIPGDVLEKKIIIDIEKAASLVAETKGGTIESVPIRTRGTKVLEILEQQPWAHVKIEKETL